MTLTHHFFLETPQDLDFDSVRHEADFDLNCDPAGTWLQFLQVILRKKSRGFLWVERANPLSATCFFPFPLLLHCSFLFFFFFFTLLVTPRCSRENRAGRNLERSSSLSLDWRQRQFSCLFLTRSPPIYWIDESSWWLPTLLGVWVWIPSYTGPQNVFSSLANSLRCET